jgi:CRISPR/Cas system-associated exonuclease Cas4 (RecB family)
MSFLDEIARFLVRRENGDAVHTLVVLPNRRSQVFLKQYLAKNAGRDYWLPDMLTIDELMAQLSGLTVIDPLVAYFELFKIHREMEGDKARDLDDFLSWAPLMLNDFSDIDYYLADAHGLFSELSEVKALEKWNLNDRPLTEMQMAYLAFFHSLFDYYERLQIRLYEKKTAYKAMAYRFAAEKLKDENFDKNLWTDYVFVGFNALTGAEKSVVASLKEHFNLHFFIDADSYYFDDSRDGNHEAGTFLREITKFLKIEKPEWVGNALLTQKKTIEVVAVPRQIGQVKYAGQLLYEWLVVQKTDARNIAVILADERLLVPLLGSVPAGADGETAFHYNVTLGYPLMQSPFYDLIYRWTQLLTLRSEDTSLRISLLALNGLMQNPLMEMLDDCRLSDFFPLNRFYASPDEIMDSVKDEQLKSLFRLLFFGWEKPGQFTEKLKNLLQKFQVLPAIPEKKNILLRFQLTLMMQMVKLAEGIFSDQKQYLGFQSIQKILLQLMGRKEVSLKGEPLTGIQVMGMLETRNLDFERVIILGANEGILPKTGFQESIIPYDLRRAYKLPLQRTKTAVASYHFFRLLQRTRHAVMIYNSVPDVMGGGEVSRFVLQIENELTKRNPQIRVIRKMVNVPIAGLGNTQEIAILKKPDIIRRLKKMAERGISLSALNTYIRCPLQFYYRYVTKIEVPEQPEVSVQSDTFGSVVHGVLEKLYKPHKGKLIDSKKLKTDLQQNLQALLLREFQKNFGSHDLKYGRNLLIYNVAKKYVERFVLNEIRMLNKEPHVLMDTEKAVSATLDVGGHPVKLKGFIDRIDKNPGNGKTRIIDYKTGSVDPKELKLKTWESAITEKKYSKAMQVLTYAWLNSREQSGSVDVAPGIISLKTARSTFLPVTLPDEIPFAEAIEKIEKMLKTLVTRIFDEEIPFFQTGDTKGCEYCDFKNLCNR